MQVINKLRPIHKDRLGPSPRDGFIYYNNEDEVSATAATTTTTTTNDEIAFEQRYYSATRLNEGQKRIYDYIHANPQAMIIIQAGPGT